MFMTKFKFLLSRYTIDESGATAIEYGLIAGLIAVAIIGGSKVIGSKVSTTFEDVGTNLE